MMKKTAGILLLTAALAMTPAALAQTLDMDGTIEAGSVFSITAPYSGTVGDFTAQAGDVIAAGEALFPIGTTTVYAQTDGTVRGVFAQAGDEAASVEGRYGALCYVERDQLFEAACTSSGADSDTEDKIVHPGEAVYLKSIQNSERNGAGRVTSVTASGYTVEITDAGDLRVNESVKVYRTPDHDQDGCIGSGRASRIQPAAVTAQGWVLSVHVEDGQRVARGDVLFEIVPDPLRGMRGGEAAAAMPQDGVLLSVSAQSGAQTAQDSVLATYCPADGVRLVCPVDETDLAMVTVGAKVNVTLDAYAQTPTTGEVEKISSAADENGEYAVTIRLEDTRGVRIGMSATATL